MPTTSRGERVSLGWNEWIAQATRMSEREGLRQLVALRATLDRVEILLVAGARARGVSWTQIGADLGIARQSAHRRHRATPLPERVQARPPFSSPARR